jgi:D-alanyl-D-alanine endopeptidase (penicillin-binding protein 7)
MAVLAVTFAQVGPAQAASTKKTAKASTSYKSAKPRTRVKATIKARRKRAAAIPDFRADGTPNLRSSAVMVQDQSSGAVLLEKNSDAVVPIASITKLMTAMVVLDAHPGLDEMLTISTEDVDTLKNTRSRLAVGTQLSREDMLRLALMSSENRAASALSRHYPGGSAAFIAAMNHKAHELGLVDTRFFDSTGLNSGNVSSARDLVKMVAASSRYPLIREFTTTTDYEVTLNSRTRRYVNTNALVSSPDWQIAVSKTGFTNEAGKCLVMQAWVNERPLVIVLMDSWGKLTRLGDANRIKKWIESAAAQSLGGTI